MSGEPTRLELTLADEAATARLAARLAAVARPGDVIALDGDLGVGKTAFARAFVQALCGGPEEVPSPTFTLVQTYDVPGGPVHHYDLYRLEVPQDALELGIEDAFADGIVLIEWPSRLGPWLPAERLDLELTIAGEPGARRARLTGYGRWAGVLARLDIDAGTGTVTKRNETGGSTV